MIYSVSFSFLVNFSQSLVDELGLLEEAASILGNTAMIFLHSVISEKIPMYWLYSAS